MSIIRLSNTRNVAEDRLTNAATMDLIKLKELVNQAILADQSSDEPTRITDLAPWIRQALDTENKEALAILCPEALSEYFFIHRTNLHIRVKKNNNYHCLSMHSTDKTVALVPIHIVRVDSYVVQECSSSQDFYFGDQVVVHSYPGW